MSHFYHFWKLKFNFVLYLVESDKTSVCARLISPLWKPVLFLWTMSLGLSPKEREKVYPADTTQIQQTRALGSSCFAGSTANVRSFEQLEETSTSLRRGVRFTRQPRQRGSVRFGFERRSRHIPILRRSSGSPGAGAPQRGVSASLRQLLDKLLLYVLGSDPRLLVCSEERKEKGF